MPAKFNTNCFARRCLRETNQSSCYFFRRHTLQEGATKIQKTLFFLMAQRSSNRTQVEDKSSAITLDSPKTINPCQETQKSDASTTEAGQRVETRPILQTHRETNLSPLDKLCAGTKRKSLCSQMDQTASTKKDTHRAETLESDFRFVTRYTRSVYGVDRLTFN
ncbi:hypothetical protein AVEN_169762-1 [Araneus ventricosus]|uniref:Uncharacterized protein n=1 Tax=Araneus ventricosus TaxID=182803 RepID=A0A4Y2HLG4_ARAVE|nr:hypothetical protein AVEN_169762-1 [Araneus ventricosus]